MNYMSCWVSNYGRLMLQANGIPVPHHIIVNRENLPEGQEDPEGFIETEDYVEMNGERRLVFALTSSNLLKMVFGM